MPSAGISSNARRQAFIDRPLADVSVLVLLASKKPPTLEAHFTRIPFPHTEPTRPNPLRVRPLPLPASRKAR